jgi:signal transduction histidine kinase
MKPRSLGTRLTLLVGITALVTVAALTAGFNLLLRSNLDSDANRVLRARATAALEGIDTSGPKPKVVDNPDEAAADSGVWIYAGGRAITRPRAPAQVQQVADSLAASGGSYAESTKEDLRLHAVPIHGGSGQTGSIVVALSMEPYERSANRALLDSAIFAIVMLLLVIGFTRLAIRTALRPVARMTAEAASWSERDLDHRFDLGPPHDELTELASTFDSMLARLAATLRHEQRLTAEVSHELRTPLAAIAAEAELALRRPRQDDEYRTALEGIQRRAHELAETLELLLTAARGQAGSHHETSDANAVAERAIGSVADGGPNGVEIHLDRAAGPVEVDASIATASQILAPLIENASRYGRGRVGVAVEGRNGQIVFTVSDDGPGIEPAERERIFEPGSRGSAGRAGSERGAGLGLALARRLARSVGGEVNAPASDNGGVVQITLPAAPW